MKITALLLLLALPLISNGQKTDESINIGAVNRTYIQTLPTGFDPATESLPVVFCLHGIGDVAESIANMGFSQIGDTARFISVYPQGLKNGWGKTSWANGTMLASLTNDVDFFNAMINDLILNHNADPSRIYISGFSMGSIMSHTLACQLNDRIAAIGAISGSMSTQDLTTCVPAYPTPVIIFHGTKDRIVPYKAMPLPTLSLVPQTINFWATAHGCSLNSDSTQIPDTAADGKTVDRFVYQTSSALKAVEFWRINGGDHEYFSEPANDFTEANEIWKFFSKWSHPNPAEAGAKALSTLGIQITPNPTKGKFVITTLFDDTMEVFSATGELVYSQAITTGETAVTLKKLDAGIYFIKLKSLSELTERIEIQ